MRLENKYIRLLDKIVERPISYLPNFYAREQKQSQNGEQLQKLPCVKIRNIFKITVYNLLVARPYFGTFSNLQVIDLERTDIHHINHRWFTTWSELFRVSLSAFSTNSKH